MDEATRIEIGKWVSTTTVARALGVGTPYVLQHICVTGALHREGELGLSDIVETTLGRLFNPEEVEFLRQARAEAKASAGR